MKHMHQEPLLDAAKKRREYLRKKANASGAIVMVCVIGGLTVAGLLGILIQGVLFTPVNSPYRPLGMAVVIIIPSLILVGFINAFKSEVNRARSIIYVPPVREQVAALSADEVLLRGSEPPTATRDELLRAAHPVTASVSRELLRSNQPPVEENIQQ